MTVGAITFDLGFGASPFLVTLDDASGLAPLTLPEALAAQTAPQDESISQKPTAEPASDAVQRFAAAMAASAQPEPEKHPLRAFRNAFAAQSAAPVSSKEPIAAETPIVAGMPIVAEKPVRSEKPIVVEQPVMAESA